MASIPGFLLAAPSPSFSLNPCFVALRPANALSTERSRPTSTRDRTRCDSSTRLARKARARSEPLNTSPCHSSASARTSSNNPGRLASETTARALRTALRHASTTSTRDASKSSASSSRRSRSPLGAIRRAAGVSRTRDAFSTSASTRGYLRGAQRSRREQVQRVPSSSGDVASRFLQRPAREQP
jgi:hypothetical protein